jgi:hypothetical protein
MIRCNTCDVEFASNKGLYQHIKGKRHINKINGTTPVLKYACGCGKTYSYRQSLHLHQMSCNSTAAPSVTEIIEELKNTVLEERKIHQLEREQYQKEHNELKAQISILLDKYAQTSTSHNNTTTSTTNSNNNTSIDTQQNNITININAFGNENIDYIDDKSIVACINSVYKSIPSLLERIHFDPEHPENHNIKITNKKLPYASVMGNNKKWKTVDRKDAIDTMVSNGYNLLDEKYTENKDKFAPSKQERIEGFLSKCEIEDKEVMKQIKSEVDMMVLNGGSK